MFLTKWNPSRSCNTVWDYLDKDFFPGRSLFEGEQDSSRRPLTNINEVESAYIISLEMPGVSKENVEVTLEGDTLTISGERKDKMEDKGLLRREIREQKFSRSFKLDNTIDREKAKAKMDNGILTVTLPKVEKEVGRKVNID